MTGELLFADSKHSHAIASAMRALLGHRRVLAPVRQRVRGSCLVEEKTYYFLSPSQSLRWCDHSRKLTPTVQSTRSPHCARGDTMVQQDPSSRVTRAHLKQYDTIQRAAAERELADEMKTAAV